MKNGFARAAILILCALSIGAGQGGRAKRVIHFRNTESQIAQVEEGAAQGHQPWHSDPYLVAQAALLQVEPAIDPKTAGSIPYERTIPSPLHQLFRFEIIDSHHLDEISVQRLHWRNPRTQTRELTGTWWATKAVISDRATPDKSR